MRYMDIGMEPRLDPPEREMPVCPWCDAETDTFYRDRDGEICGCDCCVEAADAYEYTEREQMERSWGIR